jgi:hypothetical protein
MIFGFHLRVTMILWALGYHTNPSVQQRKQAETFIRAWIAQIRCHVCSADWDADLPKHPPQCRNRITLLKWLFDFFNRLNTKLHHPTMSEDEFMSLYVHTRPTVASLAAHHAKWVETKHTSSKSTL